MNFKCAAGIFFALLVGCSSDPGPGSEQTGSAAEQVTTCQTTTLQDVAPGTPNGIPPTGFFINSSVSQATFTGYLPATIAMTNTTGVNAQIKFTQSGTTTCTYNYPAENGTTYWHPVSACTGLGCPLGICPADPSGVRFVGRTNLTLSLAGTSPIGLVIGTAVFSDDQSDGNTCTDDACIAGGGISHNPSLKGSDCPATATSATASRRATALVAARMVPTSRLAFRVPTAILVTSEPATERERAPRSTRRTDHFARTPTFATDATFAAAERARRRRL